MSINIGAPINQTTVGVVSNALDKVAEGITTRGSAGIAEAESAFQKFSQQEIAGFSPSKPLVVNDSAFYPSPTEAYKTMLKSNDPKNFSNIVNPMDVNKFLSDPNFQSAEALSNFSNNLLGEKGITDNLLGKDGFFSSMLGGIRLDQAKDDGGLIGITTVMKRREEPAVGSENASISIKDPDLPGAGIMNPLRQDPIPKMDSFEGLLNLDPYSAEGGATLKLFSEQLRSLNGLEEIVKEQVALHQQSKNIQGGKIFG